ncbi:MAG: hypothetical protein ACERKN_07270 [Velocimicrobium sp.]
MKYRYFINGEEREPTLEERIRLTETFITNLGYRKVKKEDEKKKSKGNTA